MALPDNWEIRKLGDPDLCKIVSGATPKTNEPSYWNGNILWITPKDLSNFEGFEIFDTKKKITKAGYESCSTHILPKGTVLMSSRAPIGYLAIAGNELCTNQGFKSFICTEKMNNRYLFYYLKSIVPQLEQLGSGSTFNELSKTKAEQIEIPLPPRYIQEKITAKLDEFFKEYGKAKKQHERSKDLTEKIMQATIRQLIPNPEGDLPKGFRVENVSKLCENLDKKRKPIAAAKRKKGQYPYYGATGIVDYVDNYIFDEKLVLIGEDGANLLSNVKPQAFIAEGKYWVNNHAHVLKPIETEIDPEYFIFAFNATDISPFVSGSAQPKLNQANLNKIKLVRPPLEIQKKVVRIAAAIKITTAEIAKLQEKKSKTLELLPKVVLSKAFSGQLVY